MAKGTIFTGQTFIFSPVPENAKPKEEKAEKPKMSREPKEKKVKKAKDNAESSGALLKFYKEMNGTVIDDMSNEASVNAKKSKSYMSFCRKLKNALKKEAIENGFDDVTLNAGHYEMSGLFKKGERYVYWHFSVERYGDPTSLDGTGPMNGFLYRTAKNEKDYTGGNNHFCNLLSLIDNAKALVGEGETAADIEAA